ncbi:HK97 family phage prohead protease [Tabrizicola sp.]|uniref:HK97 family phage prohead protease n=1 Tax=Tabrizicola sp. TaxID=2005166 RepID=UPI0035AFF7AB
MTDSTHSRLVPSFQVKADDSGVIEGYASVFDIVDHGGDIVVPGAFKASLAQHAREKSSPIMLWYHDPAKPIGRWTELHEDGKGLYGVGKINLDTSAGRDAYASVKSGDVTGLSIGYRTSRSEELRTGGRKLIEVDLQEVSIVTFPMNPASRLTGVKHLATKAEAVEFLREAGLSKDAAKRFAAGGFPALGNDPFNYELARKLADQVEQATQKLRRFK